MAIPTPKFMQKLELAYQQESELRYRSWYQIFYCQLVRADLLVLGLNPGGDPNQPEKNKSASTTYYENGKHEYVDSIFKIQEVMLSFLKNILKTNKQSIRLVPKTNLIFRRSPKEGALKDLHGMTTTEAMKEAVPTIEQIMGFVQPKMVLLETMKPEAFTRRYCSGQISALADTIMGEHRGSPARMFVANNMHVNCLGRELPVVAIGHPSHQGDKPGWGSVVQATRSVCERFNIHATNPAAGLA